MTANVLITGASGYLGGSLLDLLLQDQPLPNCGTIYALVRTEEQARQVTTSFKCEPLFLNLSNESELTSCLLEKKISIVFHLIDAMNSHAQIVLIKALGIVGRTLGVTTHFLHTSGAKIFSGFVGFPTDRPVSDTDEGLAKMQADAQPELSVMKSATQTNTTVLKTCKAEGVRCYIFVPCIVYGKGTGFGNKISIQTVAVVKAARELRQVCRADDLDGSWPVSHIHDNSTLYAQMLRKMLAGENIGHNEQGYYLASSGSVRWSDIYAAFAKALYKCGEVDTEEVGAASEATLEGAARGIGCPKELVSLSMGGRCAFEADRGATIGWTPTYLPQHLVETAEQEVDLILRNLG